MVPTSRSTRSPGSVNAADTGARPQASDCFRNSGNAARIADRKHAYREFHGIIKSSYSASRRRSRVARGFDKFDRTYDKPSTSRRGDKHQIYLTNRRRRLRPRADEASRKFNGDATGNDFEGIHVRLNRVEQRVCRRKRALYRVPGSVHRVRVPREIPREQARKRKVASSCPFLQPL